MIFVTIGEGLGGSLGVSAQCFGSKTTTQYQHGIIITFFIISFVISSSIINILINICQNEGLRCFSRYEGNTFLLLTIKIIKHQAEIVMVMQS